MEVKIKQGEEMIDAIIEMVDGVMVVSPKETRVDVIQFKDGDVITCGHDAFHWICILRGEIEYIIDDMFIEDYCGINSDGTYNLEPSDSDSAQWVRYATEEEKKLLFDKLKEKGLAWDAERKELVKLKWKPNLKERYYYPILGSVTFDVQSHWWADDDIDRKFLGKDWVFSTEKECKAFCDRLNEAINQVKP